MPLVTPKITVDIEGKVDDLLKDIKQIDRGLDELSKNAQANRDAFKNSFGQAGLTAKSAVSSWTEFRSAYSTVLDVVRTGEQVWAATVGKTQQYAEEVHKLSKVSGATAEDTSRMIQVLDDYGVSASRAMLASRTLSKQGYTFTIETLGKLSDQYKKLGTQQEKNAFAQKNFGRNYIDYLTVLEKGSAVLEEQGRSVSENLILNDKQVEAYRKLSIAQDQLTDSGTGWANIVSNTIVPAATWFIDSVTILGQALDDTATNHKNFFVAYRDAEKAVLAERDALLDIPPALDDATESAEDNITAVDAQKTAISRLTSEFQGLISSMFTIDSQNKKYLEDVDKMAQKEADLLAQKNQIALQMGQAVGDQEKYLSLVKDSIDLDAQLQELEQQKIKVNEDLAQASQKRIYDLAQQRLAVDGVIDSGEFEYLQQLAVQSGLVTKAAADQAIAESKKADVYVQNYQKVHPLMQNDLAVMQQMWAMSGKVVQFGVNYTSNMPGTTPKYQYSVPAGPPKPPGYQSKDSGGMGFAGTPYLIGKGAQPEMFVPSTNGKFYPNADKMGATYNITINNPKKEAAENSIRTALKKLSFVGVAA